MIILRDLISIIGTLQWLYRSQWLYQSKGSLLCKQVLSWLHIANKYIFMVASSKLNLKFVLKNK